MTNEIGTNLVDEFESAFQGILNGFTKEEVMCHTLESKEELKTDAEQNISKFIDVAKQLEIFFLQRRLQLSVLKPEQLIKEDCNELKLEIARKDELIKKHYEKITIWQSMLADLPGGSNNGSSNVNDSISNLLPHPAQQQQIAPAPIQQQFPNR